MADEISFKLQEKAGALTLESEIFEEVLEGEEAAWTLIKLDSKRLVLQTKKSREGMSGYEAGMAWCTADVFYDFLVGLSRRKWSGVVSVDTGRGVKFVHFADGEICFASSNLIDDRLGEVIYRAGIISLDKMAESAVKVTRTTKFGQVLLASGIFSTIDLWDALKIQVKEIIRSLFLMPMVYCEVKEGRGFAPTEVVFAEGSRTILEESYSFGCMFRRFVKGIHPESDVNIKQQDRVDQEFTPGTFFGDFLALIKETPVVRDLVASSKLTDVNTYVSLMILVNKGICSVKTFADTDKLLSTEGLSSLKTKLDAFSYVLRSVRNSFDKEGFEFPAKDFMLFAEKLNPVGFDVLYVNRDGTIDSLCVSNIYSQCVNNKQRTEYFLTRIEALIQFLLQVAGDVLPRNASKTIKDDYRSMRV